MPAQQQQDEEQLIEPHKVDTGESIKVKQALDEAAVQAVTEMGYQEDHKLSNWKLILMTVACTFAAVAQFYPKPFPDSKILLGSCCAVYFICNCLLQGLTTFLERDIVLVTKPHAHDGTVITVRTNFPRYQDLYSFTVEVSNANASTTKQVADSHEYKLKVGQFFDVIGYFDEPGAREVMQSLVSKALASKGKKAQ